VTESLSVAGDPAPVLLESEDELHDLSAAILGRVVGAALAVPESEAALDLAERVRVFGAEIGQLNTLK
jgi:hypothetical protein